MRYQFGDMWKVYDGVNPFLFTGNSYLRKDGELVMGKGMALQVKVRYPYLPSYFGTQIKGDFYYILLHRTTNIGVFQVKIHYRNTAQLDIIQQSAGMLHLWASARRNTIFNLNFPGIGAGRLKVEQVEPLLVGLPDNCHIWRWHNEPTSTIT